MKKFLLIITGLIIIILATAFILPIIFKDDIKTALDEEIGKNVRAKVFYDTDQLNLTLFKNFPNITAGMGNFGIVGVDHFEGDTLVSMGSFEVVIDIMSVINGDQINVRKISLVEPEIYVVVLQDGSASYDIAVASEEVEETVEEVDTTETKFNVGINKWEIVNGNIIYLDQSMGLFTSIIGLNHSGSGDFTQDLFDLTTKTTVDAWTLGYEGENYLNNKRLSVDLTLAMDLPNGTYTFKENRVALNDFGIGFDGSVAMPGEDIAVDLTFQGKDISLVRILSLIPGAYQEYLDGLEAQANINFEGFVKGVYNENSMPAVNAKLNVADGYLKYAEYPIPIEQLTIASEFDYPSVDMTQTSFDLSTFSMLVDGEEVSATLAFKNLEDYQWDFGMEGNLDLEKITRVMPLDSMELAGKINATLRTAGKMSDLEAERYDLLPTSGTMSIKDFSFTSYDLPQGFKIASSEASFDPNTIQLSSFNGSIGNSDMSLQGNLDNYMGYALGEGETIRGQLVYASNKLDLNEWMTEEDVEEEPEASTPEDTTALTVIEVPEDIDFVLKSSITEILYDNLTIKDLKGDIIVRNGMVSLDGATFNLLNGTFGMDGFYATAGLENPEFDFNFHIKDLSISESFKAFSTVQTLAPIAEGMIGNFSTELNLGGTLGQDMMPIYESLHGGGLIEIIEAAFKGDMKLMAAVNGATKLTNLSSTEQEVEQFNLKNVLMETEIKDGRVHLEPFNVQFGGYETIVSGSNGVDGSLDYRMAMDIPTGQVASAVNNVLGSYLGGNDYIGDQVQLTLGVGGFYGDPKVKVLSAKNTGGQSPAEAAKAKLAAEAAKRKKEAEDRAKRELERQKARAEAQANKAKAEAEAKAKAEAEKAKKAAEDALKKEADKVLDDQAHEATDALKSLFGKKKKKGN